MKHFGSAETKARLGLFFSMTLFGTIGLFVKYIGMPSSFIALVRGTVGALFLIAVIVIKKEKVSFAKIKKHLVLLIVSGACIGVNWIFLFEAYRYTTVAKATLCYYLAPVLVILFSPIFLKEKLTVKKALCVFTALGGMVLVSGVLGSSFDKGEIPGLLLGFGAASLYASVVMMNRKLAALSAYEKTTVQLIAAAVTVLPYVIFTVDFSDIEFAPLPLLMLGVVAVFHTGVAYAVYFGAINHIKAQSAAIMSYIDPVVAVLLSVFVLKEVFSWLGIIGAIIVLASTLISELPEKEKRRSNQ